MSIAVCSFFFLACRQSILAVFFFCIDRHTHFISSILLSFAYVSYKALACVLPCVLIRLCSRTLFSFLLHVAIARSPLSQGRTYSIGIHEWRWFDHFLLLSRTHIHIHMHSKRILWIFLMLLIDDYFMNFDISIWQKTFMERWMKMMNIYKVNKKT